MFTADFQTHLRTTRRGQTNRVQSWTAFDPSALLPFAWFDASDTATITSSGGAVSQWNDKSGYVRDLTASGTAQPATASTTLNGLNVLTFDGTSDGMATSAFTTPLNQHLFTVVRPTGFPNAYNSVVSHEGSSIGYTLLAKSTGKLAIYESYSGGNASYDGTGSTTLSTNTAYLLEYWWNGYQLVGYVNGATDATVTKTATMGSGSQVFRVGFSNFASRWWKGDIAEVVIFPFQLSVAEQTLMRNYLNRKWAIY